jgi:hypothetical protein
MSENLDEMNIEDILGEEALMEDDSVSADVVDEDTPDKGLDDLGEELQGIDLGDGLEDEVVKQVSSLEPLINDPSSLLSAGMPIGSPIQKSLEDPTVDDVLLESIKGGDPVATILNHVLEEIAEEVCYLKAQRNNGWDAETDYTDVSAKRIRSLKTLVESLIEKEKLKNSKDTGKIDFHSKNFENVFGYFLGVVKDTFEKIGVPSQYADIFFTQLAKDLDGFEKEAEKIYYGKKK